MANELCASGFTNSQINGNYTLYSTDLWTNGIYWIYKNSWWWMISASPNLYSSSVYKTEMVDFLKAIKPYTPGSWVDGEYYAIGPWENGNYTVGAKIGTISLGVC